MTDTLFATGELLGARGLVGDRQLVLVQTFDIARLTSHPVPIIPGTFIAVGGRGPKDSNESGKTSFLAATSLLLGDSGWKLTGAGGASATALLFEPETAGVSSQAYAPARHGYVLGVFAQPEDPAATALTVWLRISSSTPHILVRWKEGVALPPSRVQIDVDAAWDALGTRNQAGSNTYVERLYGDTPRCLAWVAQRGSLISEKSLLQMNAGAFKPHEIADDLISLTGRRSLFENEKEARETLFRQQEELRQRKEAYEKELAEQTRQLDAVNRRDQARRRLERAKEFWRLHCAAGLIAVLATGRRGAGARGDAANGTEPVDEGGRVEGRDGSGGADGRPSRAREAGGGVAESG